MAMAGVSYIGLLRSNAPYRRLFTANEISYVGDWFSMIALFLLAGEASDNSPLAIAGVLATRSFTFAPQSHSRECWRIDILESGSWYLVMFGHLRFW